MAKLILSIYYYFSQHRKWLFGLLIALVGLLAFTASRINFKEDISAFLPKDHNIDRINYAYQHLSSANKLVVSVSMADTSATTDEELIMDAVSYFVEQLQQADSANTYFKKIDYKIDQLQILAVSQFLINNMPYFLTESDYNRIDTLLTESRIREQLNQNRQMLMSPISMVMKQTIMADPLHWSTSVLAGLRDFQASSQFQLYHDFIFSNDRKEGIVLIESHYPISETRKNAQLLEQIDQAVINTQTNFEQNINIHYFGGIDIAVTNANRIKQDGLLSSIIAIVFILGILTYTFRSTKNILMMLASLLFGWLLALGLLTIIKDEVSLIAVGISSIIIGIAINYPLHFILHNKHEPSIPNTIKDIIVPLTIGNITTVGAFLSLMFISSEAMYDLGLFASLLLVGTICFVLFFLPHLLKKNTKIVADDSKHKFIFDKLLSWTPKRNKWFVWTFVALSIVFCVLSFNTKFDTDMRNINYMTKEQRADINTFIASVEQGQQTIYYVSEGESLDQALTAYEASKIELDRLQAIGVISSINGVGIYLPSKAMQQKQLERWKTFCESKKNILDKINKISIENGFKSDAFSNFENIIQTNYVVQDIDYFEPITSSLANNYIVNEEGNSMVMTILHTTQNNLDTLETKLNTINTKSFSFDAGTIGRSMINALSMDFNTVLYVCGLIVFVFFIFTLGRIELSLLAFLPLTIGWFWILGIMNIFDIRFNIVSIILASLIFGQGDDYTIFMTEGLMYEYTYKRKLLASYKKSIFLSAIIMFIGIGSLILAKHPALHSLAEITIIGMGSVVLMTFMIPPVLFRWLTQYKGERRMMPITFVNLLLSVYSFLGFLLGSMIISTVGFLFFTLGRPTDKKKLRYHKLIHWCTHFAVTHLPRIKTTYNNFDQTIFDKPAVIICNHQSHIDLMCVMSLTPKLIVLTNDWVENSPFYKRLIKYADFFSVSNGAENVLNKLQPFVEKGYSIMIFPEGTRSEDCSIQRFHRGAFYLAEQLNLDILPVLIHGVGHLLPKKEFMLRKGEIHIHVMPRMAYNAMGETFAERAKQTRKLYNEVYAKLAAEVETADYYADLVQHNYIYKGPSVERAVRRNLKKHKNYREIISQLNNRNRILILNCGYGELPLLFSLVHKHTEIVATDNEPDNLDLAANCHSIPSNLQYVSSVSYEEFNQYDSVVLMNPTDEQLKMMNKQSNLYIIK